MTRLTVDGAFPRWVPTSLVLVNWFTFDAETMPINGPTVVIGENGAGKSSILDALSLLLNGVAVGSTRFNAIVQGRAAARRSARDYILGTLDDIRRDQVPDPERIDQRGLYRIRDAAIAYLALTVRHSETGACGTLGACMTASSEVDDVKHVRRFIVEGTELSHEDFVRANKKGTISLEWKAFVEQMTQKGVRVKADSSGPEEFARQVFGIFGPERGIRQEVFRRNLQNALAFREQDERDISTFVRARILPPPEIDIRPLQEQIRTYKAINERVKQVESLVAEGDAILATAAEASGRAATAIRSRVLLTGDAIASADASVERASVDVAVFERALPDARQRAEDARKREDEARRALEVAAAAIEGSAAEQRRQAEEAKRQASKARLEANKGRLGDLGRLAMPAVDFCRSILGVLPGASKEDKAIANELRDADETERLSLLLEERTTSAIQRVLDSMAEMAVRAAADLQAARLAKEDALTNASRASSGRAVLGRDTLETLDLLRKEGIEADPLCDLVTEVDGEWAEATEAVLGNAREAIIVPAAVYRKAAALVRERGNPRAQMANTSKTDQTRPAERGSLATALHVTNREARAFLDYRLGRVVMVDDADSLRLEENAITRDRWRMAGRIQNRLPPPREMLLGRSARERGASLADAALKSAQEAEERAATEHRQATRMRDAASGALQAIRQLTGADLDDLMASVSEAEGDLITAEARLMEAANSGEPALRRVHERARREVEEAGRALRGAILDEGRAEQALTNSKVALDGASVQADSVRETELRAVRSLLKSFPFVDLAVKVDVEALERRAYGARPFICQTEDGRPIDRAAETKTFDYAEKRARQRVLNFIEEVNRFAATHNIELPPVSSPDVGEAEIGPEWVFATLAPWLTERVAHDRNSVLVEYRALAREALDGAMDHLRADYLGKIGGTVGEMERRLRMLNSFLQPRTFHGLRYRISHDVIPQWRDMISLARLSASDDLGRLNKLEAGNGSPEERALTWIQEQIDLHGEEAFAGDLLDPRKWFVYDIAMHLRDGQERTSMSRRGATGSGGQVQAPLYVALICSVAAASMGATATGEPEASITILLLDEAFGKLDSVALREVVSFIEQCGLTPILAVPDKERGTFRAVAETMVTVRRYGAAGGLSVQVTTQRMRDAILADRPKFPEVSATDLALESAEAGN